MRVCVYSIVVPQNMRGMWEEEVEEEEEEREKRQTADAEKGVGRGNTERGTDPNPDATSL